jgi:hypothetical protein
MMTYSVVVSELGNTYYYKNSEFHRDGDEPAVVWKDGSKYYYKNGKCHRDGVKPAIEHTDGFKRYYKNGVKYTKEQVEKMEEIRTRIVNRTLKRCARYWYDETYRNTEGEAFKRRLLRDMKKLEEEIGYKLT